MLIQASLENERDRHSGVKRIPYLAIALLTAGAAAAEGTGRLQFVWANPTASAPCGLSESNDPAGGTALRVAGTIEAQELGMACIVQIPRRKFDALIASAR